MGEEGVGLGLIITQILTNFWSQCPLLQKNCANCAKLHIEGEQITHLGEHIANLEEHGSTDISGKHVSPDLSGKHMSHVTSFSAPSRIDRKSSAN